LAQAAAIGADQAGGGAQYVGGGAVVALQPDDAGAGKVALEAQDVVHLRAPPAVDRLVVVADHADVGPFALGRGGQQPQPQILGDVGVLVFVHQDEAESAVVFGQDVRVGLE